MIFVLGSPVEDDRFVGKSKATLLVLEGGKNVALKEPIPVVCAGVIVTASVV